MLEVISHTEVDGEFPCQRPMILDKTAETRHRKIQIGIPKSLPELIGALGKKIRQRVKQINTAKSVWDVSPQPDAIHRAANFPEMFSQRARVRVTRLIVVFAACAVSCVGPPEAIIPAISIPGPKRSFVRSTAWRVAA